MNKTETQMFLKLKTEKEKYKVALETVLKFDGGEEECEVLVLSNIRNYVKGVLDGKW